jgi:PadR family transcriptional regulator, regulatory protein PadR
MEKADSTIAQMRKGVLEMCVMAAIDGQEAYASDILERLKQAHLIVVEGTLYPILSRLKNEGFLSYRWEESNSGPPRKYFSLTSIGSDFLLELKAGWTDLVGAVNRTISTNKNDSEQPNNNQL